MINNIKLINAIDILTQKLTEDNIMFVVRANRLDRLNDAVGDFANGFSIETFVRKKDEHDIIKDNGDTLKFFFLNPYARTWAVNSPGESDRNDVFHNGIVRNKDVHDGTLRDDLKAAVIFDVDNPNECYLDASKLFSEEMKLNNVDNLGLVRHKGHVATPQRIAITNYHNQIQITNDNDFLEVTYNGTNGVIEITEHKYKGKYHFFNDSPDEKYKLHYEGALVNEEVGTASHNMFKINFGDYINFQGRPGSVHLFLDYADGTKTEVSQHLTDNSFSLWPTFRAEVTKACFNVKDEFSLQFNPITGKHTINYHPDVFCDVYVDDVVKLTEIKGVVRYKDVGLDTANVRKMKITLPVPLHADAVFSLKVDK